MLSSFKSDFWALARKKRGYFSWASRKPWRLARALRRSGGHCPRCDDPESNEMVTSLFTDGLGVHPLLDCVFEAIARAESRFSLRFVPQRSHEERLTGNLVSEIEAALFLIRPQFIDLAKQRYDEVFDIDFMYYDLSRGGTIEKNTGGDLAIILVVNLPDLPPLVRYAAFQAKKINGSTSIPKEQFKTLLSQFGESAAYLFYDMGAQTLLPPMVVSAQSLKDKAEKKDTTDSFSVTLDEIDDGLPLSLWVLTRLAQGKVGVSESSFTNALKRFFPQVPQSGRLAILSIGQRLNIELNGDGGLDVSISGSKKA